MIFGSVFDGGMGMGECDYQSQQIQQQQQTMMTDMITNSPNIPILRPSVSRNLQRERERERGRGRGRDTESERHACIVVSGDMERMCTCKICHSSSSPVFCNNSLSEK